MPTPANASTLRTTCITGIVQVLVWTILGTIVSLALVAASPWIAGEGSLSTPGWGTETRSLSWVRTEYSLAIHGTDTNPPKPIDAATSIQRLQEADYGAPPVFGWARSRVGSFCYLEAGFPLRSVSGWALLDNGGKAASSQGIVAARGSFRTGVPVRPNWPALTFNAAACSVALWAVGTIRRCPGALRRYRRGRRNQCLHCAYDLRATPATAPCPECGKPNSARGGT